jgi:hypothetical protein
MLPRNINLLSKTSKQMEGIRSISCFLNKCLLKHKTSASDFSAMKRWTFKWHCVNLCGAQEAAAADAHVARANEKISSIQAQAKTTRFNTMWQPRVNGSCARRLSAHETEEIFNNSFSHLHVHTKHQLCEFEACVT